MVNHEIVGDDMQAVVLRLGRDFGGALGKMANILGGE
jgi:hypothetical protein